MNYMNSRCVDSREEFLYTRSLMVIPCIRIKTSFLVALASHLKRNRAGDLGLVLASTTE